MSMLDRAEVAGRRVCRCRRRSSARRGARPAFSGSRRRREGVSEKSAERVAGGSSRGCLRARQRRACRDQGVICVAVVFGPQVGGLVRAAVGPPSNLSRKELNGTCGRPGSGDLAERPVIEGRRQLPGLRVGADVADQARRDAVAGGLGVDEDPVLVARGRIAAELLADVDRAAQRAVGKRRRVDFDRADLRRRRTGDRVPRCPCRTARRCRPRGRWRPRG